MMNWADSLNEEDYLFVDDIPKVVESFNHPRMISWGAGLDTQNLWNQNRENNTWVFTANCDAGPHYQEDHWPGNDLRKEMCCIDWNALGRRRDCYPVVPLGPCARPQFCNPADLISVKTDRFTWYTMSSLPDWCRGWYTANCNIREPGIHPLPFGLHYDDPKAPFASLIEPLKTKEKVGLVYVNFTLYSARRIAIREAWRNIPYCTFRDSANLPRETYLEEIASHKFILCPPGCGLDQFRLYEALYLGCIPVVESCPWATHLMDAGLPVMAFPDMRKLPPPSQLEGVWEMARSRVWDMSFASKRFWKKKLEDLAEIS